MNNKRKNNGLQTIRLFKRTLESNARKMRLEQTWPEKYPFVSRKFWKFILISDVDIFFAMVKRRFFAIDSKIEDDEEEN